MRDRLFPAPASGTLPAAAPAPAPTAQERKDIGDLLRKAYEEGYASGARRDTPPAPQCLAFAISAVNRQPINRVIAALALGAGEHPLLGKDPGVAPDVAGLVLERAGWTVRHYAPDAPPDAIPTTCVLFYPGHAAAFVKGQLHETALRPEARSGWPIIGIATPPAGGAGPLPLEVQS